MIRGNYLINNGRDLLQNVAQRKLEDWQKLNRRQCHIPAVTLMQQFHQTIVLLVSTELICSKTRQSCTSIMLEHYDSQKSIKALKHTRNQLLNKLAWLQSQHTNLFASDIHLVPILASASRPLKDSISGPLPLTRSRPIIPQCMMLWAAPNSVAFSPISQTTSSLLHLLKDKNSNM